MSGAHQIIWLAPDYVYNSPSYGSRIGQSACVSSKILHVSRDVALLALDLANDRPWVAKNLLTPLPWYWKGAQGNGRRYVAFRGHCKELYMNHEHNSGVENCITGKETTDEKRIICFWWKNKKWERIARTVMKIALYCEHNDRRFTSSRELWSVVS